MSTFVKLSNRVINLAHVAFVDRYPSGGLEVHYTIPRAVVVPGANPAAGGPQAVASDHYHETIKPGEDAEKVWNALQAL